MIKVYKYRLYPNKNQQDLLWKHSKKLNSLYNYFLGQRIEVYKNNKKSISRFEQQNQLPNLKKEDVDLKNIHSQVLQEVPKRLDRSFKDFYRRVKNISIKTGKDNSVNYGFPKFRSCSRFYGICYPQSGYNIHRSKGIFSTKIYGNMKFDNHREIAGEIKQAYITCINDTFYICLTLCIDQNNIPVNNKNIIGIDVGITNLIATSDRLVIPNKTHAKYFDKEINKLKSRRDGLKKHSRNYKRVNKTIKQLYVMKNDRIKDFLHKVSKRISNIYDIVVVEDLSLKKMSESKNIGLNRELRNSQLGNFISMLEYKSKRLIKVNPYNTSKKCFSCGNIHGMPLSKRTYRCDICGYIEDRDINASHNILCLGQAILEKEYSDSKLSGNLALSVSR